MLDFGWSQMMLIAVVALVVLGPKELPRVIKTASEWIGKARALAREFRASVDEMVRESELKNIKEEFESAARKAETEFNQTIAAETASFDALLSPSGDSSSYSSTYGGDFYSAYGSDPRKPQPLMDHQRRKKPARRAPRPVYKPRLLARPEPRTGPGSVRRKVRQ